MQVVDETESCWLCARLRPFRRPARELMEGASAPRTVRMVGDNVAQVDAGAWQRQARQAEDASQC